MMSLSEGLVKKAENRSYYILLKRMDLYGKIIEPNKSLAHKIKIQPWTTIKELKIKISQQINVNFKRIYLFFQNQEIIDELTMFDYKIVEQKDTPIIIYQIQNEDKNYGIKVYGTIKCHPKLRKIIDEALEGFAKGMAPHALQDGTSGTYVIKNTKRDIIALFKPFDEEAYAPNNQKGHSAPFGSETFRKGILSGEGAIREFASFILEDKNIFDIPLTTFVEMSHKSFNLNINIDTIKIDKEISFKNGNMIYKYLTENCGEQEIIDQILPVKSIKHNMITSKKKLKKDTIKNNKINLDSSDNMFLTASSQHNFIAKKYGSFQQYVEYTEVAAEFSFSLYTKEEVHKIGILDFRIVNCDRNDENILVIKKRKKGSDKPYYKLVPIDHSLSFPSCLKIFDYELVWMGWDQAQLPFNEKMKEYIRNIDIIKDMEKLSKVVKLSEDNWKIFRISNTVLKVGTEYGLTLYDMGNLMYKLDYDHDSPSEIEILIDKTDRLCSCLKVDKRLRLFSISSNEDKSKNNNNDDDKINYSDYDSHKSSENSNDAEFTLDIKNEENPPAIKENHIKKKNKKESLLTRTTSFKELPPDDDNYDYDKIKGFKKHNELEKITEEYTFDTPFNEMYFNHFQSFLIELIKKKYPEKFENVK